MKKLFLMLIFLILFWEINSWNIKVNEHIVIVSEDKKDISILSSKLIWKTSIGEPFLRLAEANQLNPPILNGNFQMNYTLNYLSNDLAIENYIVNQSTLLFSGKLLKCFSNPCETLTTFNLSFHFRFPQLSVIEYEIAIQEIFPDSTKEIHSIFQYYSDKNESLFGFGKSFTFLDLKGKIIPLIVSEQGVGRGLQPISDYYNNDVALGSGGYWFTTYSPKPIYLTNHNRSFILNTSYTCVFNTSRDSLISIDIWSQKLIRGVLISADSALQSVEYITLFTGRQSPLPAWSQQGAIIGLEGGTKNVSLIVEKLISFNVPIAGIWLQDWVGMRHSWDGDRLLWNWELNYDYYPHWNQMISQWKKQHNIRVLTYLNPFFSNPQNLSNFRRNFFQEGIDNSFFVKQENGSVYLMYSLSIEFATLDLTNPEARVWMKEIIIEQTLEQAQSSGWMSDFGEYLPFDAVLFSKEGADSFHNSFPQEWSRLTYEAIQEYHQKANIINDSEILFFSRSSWINSPNYVSVFWLGDQLMSFDVYDGLQSVIVGALSSGLTGEAISHSDIGGYNAVMSISEDENMTFIRDQELLMRWSELSAFGAGLFRTHIGSSRSPEVSQIYDSPASILHFKKFAQIFSLLSNYRLSLMDEASKRGYPLMRSLGLHYNPSSSLSSLFYWNITNQFLFGEEWLIAPVLCPNCNQTQVIFPGNSGIWIHLWTGQHVQTKRKNFVQLNFDSPLGYPAVFYKQDSKSGQYLRNWVVTNS